jgi:hypothetical protein
MPKQQTTLSQRKKTIRNLNNINHCNDGAGLGGSPQAPSIRAPYLAQVRTLPQNLVFALAELPISSAVEQRKTRRIYRDSVNQTRLYSSQPLHYGDTKNSYR